MSVDVESEATYSPPVWLDLDELDARPASEMRAVVDENAITEYAEHFKALPPIQVAVDAQGRHWIEDGFHRFQAARVCGKTKIRCRVRSVKDYVEAFAAACRANEENRAIRITNADKRRRVEIALRHEEMSLWSNRLVAQRCGVASDTVNRIRHEIQANDSFTCTSVKGADGKTYPVKSKFQREPKLHEPEAVEIEADAPPLVDAPSSVVEPLQLLDPEASDTNCDHEDVKLVTTVTIDHIDDVIASLSTLSGRLRFALLVLNHCRTFIEDNDPEADNEDV